MVRYGDYFFLSPRARSDVTVTSISVAHALRMTTVTDGVVLSSPDRNPPNWAGNGNPGLRGALDVRYGFPHAQAVPGDARGPVEVCFRAFRDGFGLIMVGARRIRVDACRSYHVSSVMFA